MQRHVPHQMPKTMHTANVCATIISRPVHKIAHLDRAIVLVTLVATVGVAVTVSKSVAVTVKVKLTVLVTRDQCMTPAVTGAAHEHALCLAALGLVAGALGLNADALGPPATAQGLIAAAQKPAADALRLDATALRLSAAHAHAVMEGDAGRPARTPFGCSNLACQSIKRQSEARLIHLC